MLLFAFGSSQQIIMLHTGSPILLLAGLLLTFRGPAALRAAFFPLFFLIFIIPLPKALVAEVTASLKSAVLDASKPIHLKSASLLHYRLGAACDTQVDLLVKSPQDEDQPIHHIARHGGRL